MWQGYIHLRRDGGRSLRHLTVNPRPALVALAGELVLHVEDIVVVEVSADVKKRASGRRVSTDVEETWI